MLFAFAASDPRIRLAAADVRSAFLKGDYLGPERVLYGRAPNPNRGSSIPGVGSRLIQLKKGVFGLADAPRGWFKRLSRCFAERGWETSTTDQATWLKFEGTGEDRKLVGMKVPSALSVKVTASASVVIPASLARSAALTNL